MNNQTTWRKDTYKPGIKRTKRVMSRWKKLCNRVFKRDSFVCAMCLNSIKLTAHHLKPRSKGGKDHMNNLISLCAKCHDIAECEQLTKKEIKNYYLDHTTLIQEPEDTVKSAEWTKWVYGGRKRPV